MLLDSARIKCARTAGEGGTCSSASIKRVGTTGRIAVVCFTPHRASCRQQRRSGSEQRPRPRTQPRSAALCARPALAAAKRKKVDELQRPFSSLFFERRARCFQTARARTFFAAAASFLAAVTAVLAAFAAAAASFFAAAATALAAFAAAAASFFAAAATALAAFVAAARSSASSCWAALFCCFSGFALAVFCFLASCCGRRRRGPTRDQSCQSLNNESWP